MRISKHNWFMYGMFIIMLDRCMLGLYVLLHVAADINVVLAERKLMTYVYAVGKQPCSNP